ncbi:MAG: arylamine N-acetyltransferase [Candidatus Aegiribacteria sp.]|nr:arylamine N-acetyltransferase [Candidatus Aegiribacteria sp.]
MADRRKITRTAAMFFDYFDLVPDDSKKDSLQKIVQCFSNIPWENLTKFLAKAQLTKKENRLRLPGTVISEHIQNGAGGTCFSLTATLGEIIGAAGYTCNPVMAEMQHGKNIHCALSIITPDGNRFLADPGYLVPVPIPLEPRQNTRLDVYGQKLIWEPDSDGESYDMYTIEGENKQWRYKIWMKPVSLTEFRRHWQMSFDATGMNSLHLNRLREDRRLSAHNLNLRIVVKERKHNEKLRDNYSEQIEKYFGLNRTVADAAFREWRKSCLDR